MAIEGLFKNCGQKSSRPPTKTTKLVTSLNCRGHLVFILGFLGKRVEDLSKAVTDLLVRQKQVTVGLPPDSEVIVSGGAALKSRDLIYIILNAMRGKVMHIEHMHQHAMHKGANIPFYAH